jgi:hypothetical protein
MKKNMLSVWIIFILLLSIIIAGCSSNTYRSDNPDIILTANLQNNGSYTKNYVDVENKYLVTVNIFNNGIYIAKNVQIDQFSYCNNRQDFPFHNCISDNNFLIDIGDLQPNETKIRYYNFERSAWIFIADEKYDINYRVSSEYPKVAPD